jgi:copper transport protein
VAGSEAVSAAGETVRIALASAFSPGSYVVSYRVISADGHPVSGSTVFGIGAEAARSSREPGEAPDAALLAGLSAVNRTVQYGTLLGAVGGALFLLLVLGRAHSLGTRLRDGLCGLIALATATSVLAVGLNGAQLTGTPVAGLLTAAPWAAAASTSVQAGAAATLGGLLVLALGLALRRRSLAAGALALGSLLAASSLALTGHAATAPPRALSLPAVFLHGLAAAFWIGSLWPLLIVLRGAPAAEAHVLVARFSRLAVGAVAVLVVAGIVLSVVQIEAPEQILATSYGRIWAVKIGFVALLLGLAALNRRVLTRRLTKAGPHAAAALCRSIAAELVCATSILAATALLG